MSTPSPSGSARVTTGLSSTDDPFLWLEEVEGDASLTWVRERNATTSATLAATPEFAHTAEQIRTVLDSDAKIPGLSKIGDLYYNFWKDAEHPRGLWRRTTLEEYRTPEPAWETVLDLDALAASEGESWVWHGASVLRPEYRRALVDLSRGGADADVTRELDLVTLSFIEPEEGGFYRPESKGGLSWIDDENVYVYTDFGPGTMTPSGYPRIVKRWRRGTPLTTAEIVYEGQPDDMAVHAFRSHTPGYVRDFVARAIEFYRSELYLVSGDELVKIDVPASAEVGIKRQWLLIELRDEWTVAGSTYAAGALLAADLEGFVAGARELDVLFEPTATTSLAGTTWTKNHLVLNVLDHVRNRLHVFTPPGTDDTTTTAAERWVSYPLTGVPDMGTVGVSAVDSDASDDVWLVATDYLTPTTLSLLPLGSAPEELRAMPVFFESDGLTIDQHFAVSEDGTRVPYFEVRRADLVLDGTAPTLLYGYGGFEISLTPAYSGGLGRAWLEHGGVYVVANIRGGGEYGPRWHQLALKQHRHRAYEDFVAVARDLLERRVTSTPHLGVQGGSNGGLLTGNMLTQHPELFGAVVVQVPLLDMRRYSHLLAGASWMAEYGDPDDPAQWEFIKTFSPYHLFDPARTYPPVLFTTSTKDDRVHPGHARKLAAAMIAAGKDVTYYENIEGGHGGAANNAQAAHMSALAYRFLWERLA
ncbi:prolyl oligopeptidase family serine peptidase [Sanguibacter antarcticus]|uniref:Prolyl oligopeptidase n=1 Tax=Sanguibacter antarcticus TaxID=372484 RepID=A0A2A9E363_9MICO|nr:prolyl oligopeptidase family serine peptidase [Sanguibacter antarcticus]PFG32662.1 prolyl oligopeptidase [Sanguibacter antarcticus]